MACDLHLPGSTPLYVCEGGLPQGWIPVAPTTVKDTCEAHPPPPLHSQTKAHQDIPGLGGYGGSSGLGSYNSYNRRQLLQAVQQLLLEEEEGGDLGSPAVDMAALQALVSDMARRR